MAAKSSFKNMALCLTLVCLVCAAVLGVVFTVTEQPIKDAQQKALVESLGKVLVKDGGVIDSEASTITVTIDGKAAEYEYYKQVSDSAVVAYAVKSTTTGFGGKLVVMVGVLPDGTVWNTSVLEHSETPGLGAKCETDETFMANFQNNPAVKVLKVQKDGGDVVAITASTITSRAYTLAVKNAVEVVNAIVNPAETVTEPVDAVTEPVAAATEPVEVPAEENVEPAVEEEK